MRGKSTVKISSGKSDVQERLQGEHIVKAINTQRLRWYDHIRRMGEEEVMKKMTESKPDLEEQEEGRKADGRNRYLRT